MGNDAAKGAGGRLGAARCTSSDAIAAWLRGSGLAHEFKGKFKADSSATKKYFRYEIPGMGSGSVER